MTTAGVIKGLGLLPLGLSLGDGLGHKTIPHLGIEGSSWGDHDAPWRQSGPHNLESQQSQIPFREAELQEARAESGDHPGQGRPRKAVKTGMQQLQEMRAKWGVSRHVHRPWMSPSFSVLPRFPPPLTGPDFYLFYMIPSIKKKKKTQVSTLLYTVTPPCSLVSDGIAYFFHFPFHLITYSEDVSISMWIVLISSSVHIILHCVDIA